MLLDDTTTRRRAALIPITVSAPDYYSRFRFQNISLGKLTNAPPSYVSNRTLYHDLK